jgi:hypothetical protein
VNLLMEVIDAAGAILGGEHFAEPHAFARTKRDGRLARRILAKPDEWPTDFVVTAARTLYDELSNLSALANIAENRHWFDGDESRNFPWSRSSKAVRGKCSCSTERTPPLAGRVPAPTRARRRVRKSTKRCRPRICAP